MNLQLGIEHDARFHGWFWCVSEHQATEDPTGGVWMCGTKNISQFVGAMDVAKRPPKACYNANVQGKASLVL